MIETVIIPSAVLVPKELQTIGKLPAIIYPVNQRIVFDYLADQYAHDGRKIRVVCYEQAEKVFRRLRKYKISGLEIEKLNRLADLGYSVYCAIEKCDTPVIINFADTIVMSEHGQLKGDSFFYASDYLSETWTFYEEDGGRITTVYDKTDTFPPTQKGNLFAGVFRLEHTAYFRECLGDAFVGYEEKISTFYYALKKYSQRYPLTPVFARDWFDIGHAEKYYDSRLAVKAREFNHIEIDKARGILRKTSEDKEKFINEIYWYLKLPADVEYVRPRIFSYSTNYNSPYVSMEYYAYHTLHELFLYGDLNCHQWENIFHCIRFMCDDFGKYKVEGKGIRQSLEDMYLTKTLQRLDMLKEDKRFAPFFENDIQVNGTRFRPLDRLAKSLLDEIPKRLYDVDHFTIIHGDLCFANIMVDNNFSFIKVIDPRGRFGNYDIYGDFRYELAKLFHSMDGKYDFIIKDLFDFTYDLKKTRIDFQIQERMRGYDLYEVFMDVFRMEIGNNLKEIELIEALLFLSMIPLHRESLEHQLVMLGTGLEIMDRVMDIRA